MQCIDMHTFHMHHWQLWLTARILLYRQNMYVLPFTLWSCTGELLHTSHYVATYTPNTVVCHPSNCLCMWLWGICWSHLYMNYNAYMQGLRVKADRCVSYSMDELYVYITSLVSCACMCVHVQYVVWLHVSIHKLLHIQNWCTYLYSYSMRTYHV